MSASQALMAASRLQNPEFESWFSLIQYLMRQFEGIQRDNVRRFINLIQDLGVQSQAIKKREQLFICIERIVVHCSISGSSDDTAKTSLLLRDMLYILFQRKIRRDPYAAKFY